MKQSLTLACAHASHLIFHFIFIRYLRSRKEYSMKMKETFSRWYYLHSVDFTKEIRYGSDMHVFIYYSPTFLLLLLPLSWSVCSTAWSTPKKSKKKKTFPRLENHFVRLTLTWNLFTHKILKRKLFSRLTDVWSTLCLQNLFFFLFLF